MLSDVAQGGSAEQGIGDGMQQDIGIRMAEQARARTESCTPPMISGRPGTRRWMSQPSPMRSAAGGSMVSETFMTQFLVGRAGARLQ